MKLAKHLLASLLAVSATQATAANSVHEFQTESITGENIPLNQYAGKILVFVNTASRCGFTKQYADLVQLQKDYADKGVVVIGFPSGNFGGQELDSNQEIAAFCDANFGVDFPLMAKSDVRGDSQHPLFAYLTTAVNPDFTGGIRWNFEKFIIDQQGVLQRRFRSRTSPASEAFREALDNVLAVD